MIEFALVLPMLILLLCGVVFCGGLVVTEQNLAIAARGSARAMALASTQDGLKNAAGMGGAPNQAAAKKALDAAIPNGTASLAGVSWTALGATGRGHAGAYVKSGSVTLGGDLGTAKCGVGVALYGVTVKKDLSRDLSPIGRLAARMAPGGGLANAITPTLSATAVMPAELPIRSKGGLVGGAAPGVLDLNPWITKVVRRSYKPTSFD